MSRRFGRNQRRKMREQLALLEYECGLLSTKASMQEGSLRKARKQTDELEQQLRVAKTFLGPNHPAFPAGGFDPGFKPQPEEPFCLPGDAGQALTATVMRFGRPRRDDYRAQVHFMLYAGAEQFGYAISDVALREHRPEARAALAQMITASLVDLLLDSMNKEPRP